MSSRTLRTIGCAIVIVGAAVRLHDAWSFPVLGGYDAFGHFTYVWYVAATHRVPLPTAGWEFFQPPLYYALMAAIWRMLAGSDPLVRLRIGITLVALGGLIHPLVVWRVVRERVSRDRWVAGLAGAFMLFLPVHLYSAAFLGNEGLTAITCTAAFALLLHRLRQPTWRTSALLGLVLGLAMLTKITAVALVAGAVATIAAKALYTRRVRVEAAHLALTILVMLITCGWYYARNVEIYGTPFVMSRKELMLRIVENSQPQARRSVAEYLLFDPVVFRRPAWPRPPAAGSSADSGRALRDAVWTGLYANTWFDGFGGWTVPRVTDSELARRAGQALLALGVIPTALVLLGIASAIVQLYRNSWDDLIVATVLPLAAMLVVFVVGTRAVPIAAAVKATYLMPVTASFGVCFALGVVRLCAWYPRAVRLVAIDLATLSAIAVAVFWHGLLFTSAAIRGSFPMIHASEENLYGVIYYAGGDRDAARRHFRSAAEEGLHLGYENLALLALDDHRPREALHLFKRALRLQQTQSFGVPADRALYDRVTRAEYLNLLSIAYDQEGRIPRARRLATAAVVLDPTLPEAHYDAAVTAVAAADRTHAGATTAVEVARAHLDRALALDPGFTDARRLRALLSDRDAACRDAAPTTSDHAWRRYPVETGTGAPHAASIGRRRHIADAAARVNACAAARAE